MEIMLSPRLTQLVEGTSNNRLGKSYNEIG